MPEIETTAAEVKERKKPGPKPKSKVESIDPDEPKIDPVIKDNVENNVEAKPEITIASPDISESTEPENKLEPENNLEPENILVIYDKPVELISLEILSTSGKTVMVYRNKNFKGVAIRYKGALKVMNEVDGGYKVSYMNSGFGYCIGYVKESAIKAIRPSIC